MAPDTSSSFELGPDLICPYNNCGDSDGKESAHSVEDLGSIPGLGRFPGEGIRHSTPVFLPGESHGQGSLLGYSSQGVKDSDITE